MVASLILCRSDAGDGGWSLHPPGTTDEAIAAGEARILASGEAEMVDGEWDRPNNRDWAYAEGVLARLEWRGPQGDGTMGNLSMEHLNRIAAESGDASAWWAGWDAAR